jgi:predicted DNA-binding transcriptional regulator AlpA
MKPITLQLSVTIEENSVATLVDLMAQVVNESVGQSAARQRLAVVEPSPKPKMTPAEASQHALFAGQKPPEDRGLLIDTRQATKLLNLSSRTLWTMYHTGRMPQPIRIGRAIRWSLDELRAWVAEGCPSQDKWEWSKRPTTS